MAKEKVGKEDGEKQNYEQYLMRFIESHKIYLYEMNNTNIKLMKPISLTLK